MADKLRPRQQMPDVSVAAVGGGRWVLQDSRPEHFTMLVFYRGYHCPICRAYLGELNRLVRDFADAGVATVAISSDVAERAAATRQEWGLEGLTIGYGLAFEMAEELGLYVSSAIGKTSVGIEEPSRFAEPGIFLVRPDGSLYWSQVQTMPFARPHFDEILGAINKVLKLKYPARGELA